MPMTLSMLGENEASGPTHTTIRESGSSSRCPRKIEVPRQEKEVAARESDFKSTSPRVSF